MNTTTISLKKYVAITFIAVMILAPLQAIFAQTTSVTFTEKPSLFASLRERQITNREKVKENLLQILSSEDAKQETLTEEQTSVGQTTVVSEETTAVTIATPTAPVYIYDISTLATITYRLTDIADRLESRMLILKSQDVSIHQEAYTNLELARTGLENILLQLMIPDQTTVDGDAVVTELITIRTELQNVIATLKQVLTQ